MSDLTKKPTADQVKRLPKALLHDHLDGGLRPQTIIDIAKEIGHELPTYDPAELAEWFRSSCDSGSLVLYLETFAHTVAVMQRKQDIVRVARECAVDLARDGVVYAEVRMAPELITEKGLTLSQAIEAILEGFREGEAEAKSEGNVIRVMALLCGMRQNDLSQEVAELAVKYRDQGVVGLISQALKMVSHLVISSTPLNFYAVKMHTSLSMLVRHTDFLQSGKQFNYVVLSA